MALAARAEGRSRRDADPGLIDRRKASAREVGEAVDRAKEIERRLGLEKTHPARRQQALTEDVARTAATLDLAGEETSPSSSAATPRAG